MAKKSRERSERTVEIQGKRGGNGVCHDLTARLYEGSTSYLGKKNLEKTGGGGSHKGKKEAIRSSELPMERRKKK